MEKSPLLDALENSNLILHSKSNEGWHRECGKLPKKIELNPDDKNSILITKILPNDLLKWGIHPNLETYDIPIILPVEILQQSKSHLQKLLSPINASEDSRDKFIKQMGKLSIIFREAKMTYAERMDRIHIYFDIFKNKPLAAFKKATTEIAETNKFFPRPVEFTEKISLLTADWKIKLKRIDKIIRVSRVDSK